MAEIFLAKWFPPVLNPSCFLPSSPLLMVLQAITSYRIWQFTSWGSVRAWPAVRSSLTKFTLTRALNSQKAFALVPASRCRGYWGLVRGTLQGEKQHSSHAAEYMVFGDEKQTERDISSYLTDPSKGSMNCAAKHRTPAHSQKEKSHVVYKQQCVYCI